MGRYKAQKKTIRAPSGISVQDMNLNALEIVNCRKAFKKEHPLHREQPDEWNNIAIPVRDGMKNLM